MHGSVTLAISRMSNGTTSNTCSARPGEDRAAGPGPMNSGTSWMPCSTWPAAAVPGGCSLMTFPLGAWSPITSIPGAMPVCWSRSTPCCASTCGRWRAGSQRPVLPSSIASRSRPLKLEANEGTTPEKNRWPQAASARRYVGPDLGSGGAPRRCAGSRCGQALAGEGAGTLAAAARPLGRRRLCGRSRLGAAPLSLAADNHTQAGEPSSLCGLAQALDCGANLCLVGALPASQQGLRNQSAQQRSLQLYCDDPSHEPVCAAGVPVKTSIVRRPLRFKGGVDALNKNTPRAERCYGEKRGNVLNVCNLARSALRKFLFS